MGPGQLSRSELLADAQAILEQDDREQAERSQRHRRNKLLTALLVACLIVVAMAPLIASRSSKTATGPTPRPAASQSQK